MKLELIHDQKAGVLRLLTDEQGITSSSLWDDPDVVLDLAGEDEKHPVAMMLLGASAYEPLGKRCYDATQDLLALGDTTQPNMTRNGDLVAYWAYEDGESVLVGAELRQASQYLDGITG